MYSVHLTNLRSIHQKRCDLHLRMNSYEGDIIFYEMYVIMKYFLPSLTTQYTYALEGSAETVVFIANRNHIFSSLVPVVSRLEIIFVRLGSYSSQTIVGICYRPPSFTEDFVS